MVLVLLSGELCLLLKKMRQRQKQGGLRAREGLNGRSVRQTEIEVRNEDRKEEKEVLLAHLPKFG